jgi:hypothetical protein
MCKLLQSIVSLQCLKTSVISVSQFSQFLRQNVDFINFMYLKYYFVQILQLGQNGQKTVKMPFAGSSSSDKCLLLHHNLNKYCCLRRCYTMQSGTSIPTLQTHLLSPLSWQMYPHSSTVIMEATGTNEMTEENNLHFQSVQWEPQIS